MTSKQNLQLDDLLTIVESLTAILVSPVILPIAAAIKQPLVQATIQESITFSERWQNVINEVAQGWEKTTTSRQEPREKYYQPHVKNGRTDTAKDFLNLVSNLNTEVKRMTNDVADLRVILPLGIGLLAVRQLLRQGWKLEDIPWYVLAWYAIDIFIKLNYESETELVEVTRQSFSLVVQEQQESDSSNTYTNQRES